MYNIEDYDYDLREELIAQVPAPDRDGSRLLFVDLNKSTLYDHHFFDLPGLLKPGDLIVVNNTKVIPARLFGNKSSGGKVEILILEHKETGESVPDLRWCLLKASKRPRIGSRLIFENSVSGIVEDLKEEGLVKIRFNDFESLNNLIEEKGEMPLPHYIRRHDDSLSDLDRERYQTIFSRIKGAIAAPTAGLHFTESSLEKLRQKGVSVKEVTLHVGHGTFRPVRVSDIRDHDLGEETYYIESSVAEAVNSAKNEGRRVIAVGTTVVRTLESAVSDRGKVRSGSGKTGLLITPGYRFRVIDGMITNFHLPRSSLLFLVSAFAGIDLIKKAYRWAVEKEYRFYSYGDAMLIIL